MSTILKKILCFSYLATAISVEVKAKEAKAIEVHNLGVHGAIFTIEETSLLDVMMKRLNELQACGKLGEMQEKMASEAKKRALEPKRLEHITKTTRHRVYHYDPTLVIESDIKIPKQVHGKQVIIAQKGDLINPLNTVQLTKGLLFIDGEDPEQLKLIDSYSNNFEIILIAGKPIELKDQLNMPIYFDQGGALTKRFGVSHVPAKVEQVHKTDRFLKITEFRP